MSAPRQMPKSQVPPTSYSPSPPPSKYLLSSSETWVHCSHTDCQDDSLQKLCCDSGQLLDARHTGHPAAQVWHHHLCHGESCLPTQLFVHAQFCKGLLCHARLCAWHVSSCIPNASAHNGCPCESTHQTCIGLLEAVYLCIRQCDCVGENNRTAVMPSGHFHGGPL